LAAVAEPLMRAGLPGGRPASFRQAHIPQAGGTAVESRGGAACWRLRSDGCRPAGPRPRPAPPAGPGAGGT